jgi:hypothetical protein
LLVYHVQAVKCHIPHTTVIKEQGIFCLFSCSHWLYWKSKKCMWNVSKLCFFQSW